MNIPQVDFHVLNDENNLEVITTRDIFLGKRTVLIMLPGAFTPTCTEQQLPGFEAAYDEIASNNVNQVLCVSVNDAYVMKAWGEALGIEKVTLIPDGNAAFTNGIKGAVAKENVGMGLRAWRLAMVINAEGVVEWAGVEEGQRNNASDDPYEKSTPEETIMALRQLGLQQLAAETADQMAAADVAAAPVVAPAE